jgi:hypothetical protein
MAERPGVMLRGKQAPVRLWAPVIEVADTDRTDRPQSPQARAEPVAD